MPLACCFWLFCPAAGFSRAEAPKIRRASPPPGAAGYGYSHHIFTSPSVCAAAHGSLAIYRKYGSWSGSASRTSPLNNTDPFASNSSYNQGAGGAVLRSNLLGRGQLGRGQRRRNMRIVWRGWRFYQGKHKRLPAAALGSFIFGARGELSQTLAFAAHPAMQAAPHGSKPTKQHPPQGSGPLSPLQGGM